MGIDRQSYVVPFISELFRTVSSRGGSHGAARNPRSGRSNVLAGDRSDRLCPLPRTSYTLRWSFGADSASVATPGIGVSTPFLHGLARAIQMIAISKTVTHRIQPRTVVLTPMYLRPDAKMTNVMTGRMNRSGAREDRNDPMSTAGTLPTIIEVVTENSTWPKAKAPSAAAPVSGTACTRSVPTSWLAPSNGYTNNSSTMIKDPEPTEVIPTMIPPSIPIATEGSGRSTISWTTPFRR